MIIVKNAFRNMIRNKGRNILIGIIITIVTLCTCIALAIHQAGTNLVQTYKDTNPLSISFSLNMNELRNVSDDEKNDFTALTVEDVKKYGDSDFVKDYYYTLEASLSSDDVSAVNDNVRPSGEKENVPDDFDEEDTDRKKDMGDIGDFRITAYSNFAYLSDFTESNKKIIEGSMVTGDSDEDAIVISESLADDNDIEIGDEVRFYLPSNEDDDYTFTVVGIFEEVSSDTSSDFMGMSVLNGSNQIYANLSTVQKILDDQGEDDTKLVANNGLNAEFYLYNNDDLEKFYEEVQEKGLSNYYSVTTNEDEINQQLEPIQNIVSFSIQFLVVILIIGVVVLTIINFLNIRDRKYEIGVLRAIGMSKFKVTSQLILEIFFVAIISLIIGTTSGVLFAQPVTDTVLEQEISSYTENTMNTQNNFGGQGFEKPSQDVSVGGKRPNGRSGEKGSTLSVSNYVDSLTVHISAVTILELLGISIILIVGSSVVACIFVNKYNPNAILQNRN